MSPVLYVRVWTRMSAVCSVRRWLGLDAVFTREQRLWRFFACGLSLWRPQCISIQYQAPVYSSMQASKHVYSWFHRCRDGLRMYVTRT